MREYSNDPLESFVYALLDSGSASYELLDAVITDIEEEVPSVASPTGAYYAFSSPDPSVRSSVEYLVGRLRTAFKTDPGS